MISIPVAVNAKFYEWELDLFSFQMDRLYGGDATSRWIAALVTRNHPSEKEDRDYKFAHHYPHRMVKGFLDCDDRHIYHHQLVPINIQYALLQIIHEFKDDQVIQLLDSDMFFMKKYPEYKPKHMEVLVDTSYERWHLHATGKNRHLIQPYLNYGHGNFNGGFMPMIATALTWKVLLPNWIESHTDFVWDVTYELRHSVEPWWAGMYTFSVACANNRIKMIPNDIMYTRGINDDKVDQMLLAHYCCDHIYIEKGGHGRNLFTQERFDLIDNEKTLEPYLEPFRSWRREREELVKTYMNG